MWKKFLEMIGIQMMKTEEAMEASIDKIDRAKLAMKQDETKLKELETNLERARTQFNVHRQTRKALEEDFEKKGKDLKEIINNYSVAASTSNPTASPEEIKQFVSEKLAQDVSFDLLKQSVDTIKQKIVIAKDVEAKHEVAVADISSAMNQVRRTLAFNKNQLEIIESQRSAAEASLEAASLASSANTTSSGRIEEAKQANILIQATADAKLEGAKDNPNVTMQLDNALNRSRAAVMTDDISDLITDAVSNHHKQITQ